MDPDGVERKLAAILSADVAGYSALMANVQVTMAEDKLSAPMSHLARSAVLWLYLAVALPSPLWAAALETPPNFTIAFIGDQGLGPDPQAVLQLIQDEGADAVLHQGDFDYQNDPRAWDDQISAILGPDFPYFASAGNHDFEYFFARKGYLHFLAARMFRLGIGWSGTLGAKSSFKYKGIFFVLTSPGIFGPGNGFFDDYIRDELAADGSIWRISGWHKSQRLMQVGGKPSETGWGVYEESRRGGAIIATAHEHSYSRTHLLSDCSQQTVASTSDTLVLARDDPATPADEGQSFVFVSGLGGRSIRDQELSGAWWASIYTSTQNADFGALFGVFNYEGNPRLAYFYFKALDGTIADEFFVQSPLGEEPVLCGDVNGDGTLNASDVLDLRLHLTGIPLPLGGETRCPVIGEGIGCDLLDLTVLHRTVEGPSMPPGIAQICGAAFGL